MTLNLNNTSEVAEASAVPGINLPLGLTIELAIFFILSENLIVLLSMRLCQKLKVADLLILSLAGSDFVNACFPLQIINVKANFEISPWPKWLCGTFVWATYTLRMASLSTVSLMSIEKAVLFFQPLRYYTQLTLSLMRKLILAAWVSSALIATVPSNLNVLTDQMSHKDVFCRYQPYEFGLEFGVFVEAIGILHFAIVLGSYVAMVISSKSFRRRQKSLLTSQNRTRQFDKARVETQGMLQARRLCRVMGYVVLLYYIAWLPFLVSWSCVQIHCHSIFYHVLFVSSLKSVSVSQSRILPLIIFLMICLQIKGGSIHR